ncbi:MAG: hypothetical protein HZB55_05295 [Deltaproteobacteria bacterium]|nr:hypothetical protein [Deltaproteobacteria bacterium]
MTMIFTPGWNQTKLGVVPILGPTPTKKQIKNKAYIETNNQKRLDGAIFLTLFSETDVRNAIQKAQAKYNSADVGVKIMLTDMIGSAVTITIDQGTHQEEDVATGGFKLHFDARRPDNKCFHLYVGQEDSGALKIIEISYMNGGTKVEAHPS